MVCAASGVRADVPEPEPGTAVWLLTLETIKTKVQDLMERNTQLTGEYTALNQDVEQLNASVTEKTNKNAALSAFLKDRHGRSDQQLHLEELTAQIKDKKALLVDLQRETDNLKRQATALERTVNIKQLKISEMELKQNTQAAALPAPVIPAMDPLDSLRKELEAEKTKEVQLENELAQLSNAPKAVAEEASRQENKDRYAQALQQKTALEEKIRGLEAHLGQMKAAGQKTGSFDKKSLIQEIVQADNANQQLRSNADHLREDIVLLRDQIGRLERRANVVKKYKVR